jgi:hypothetical protein
VYTACRYTSINKGSVTFHGGDMPCGNRFLASDSLPWTQSITIYGVMLDQFIATCMDGSCLTCHRIVDKGSCQLEGVCAVAGLGCCAVADKTCWGPGIACVAMDWPVCLLEVEGCM